MPAVPTDSARGGWGRARRAGRDVERPHREHGTGANLAAVAATGVSRATLYRYCASREALLDALTGVAVKAITLTQHRQLGAEAASAAAASLFLHGIRHR